MLLRRCQRVQSTQETDVLFILQEELVRLCELADSIGGTAADMRERLSLIIALHDEDAPGGVPLPLSS